MCVCVCVCVCCGGKVQAEGSAALWLVSSVARGSMSGYSLDNHSKPGCLPIAQSGGRGGKPAE